MSIHFYSFKTYKIILKSFESNYEVNDSNKNISCSVKTPNTIRETPQKETVNVIFSNIKRFKVLKSVIFLTRNHIPPNGLQS